jgi:uncharacterized cupin superfamily protein
VTAEARIVVGEGGLVPEGEGWFVVNAREAQWGHTAELGSFCSFEGDVGFAEYGINLHVLQPGQPNCMYHAEDAQEDFLVLWGECVLVIEGEERQLRAWDFVHCPRGTEHVFVGAGTWLCVLLMAGARRAQIDIRYPANEIAQRHRAAVDRETTSGREAYARFEPSRPGPAPELP